MTEAVLILACTVGLRCSNVQASLLMSTRTACCQRANLIGAVELTGCCSWAELIYSSARNNNAMVRKIALCAQFLYCAQMCITPKQAQQILISCWGKCCGFYQPLLHLIRHTKLATDANWNQLQRSDVQNINKSITGCLVCWPLLHMVAVDYDKLINKHHEFMMSMLEIPDHQSLRRTMTQTLWLMCSGTRADEPNFSTALRCT